MPKTSNNVSAVTELFSHNSLTYEQARKTVQEMNLINGFLFDSSMSDEGNAVTISRIILERVLNRPLPNIVVAPQKTISGIDSNKHGIRFDALVTAKEGSSDDLMITIYDIEMEDRVEDRPSLPKRQRYYRGLSDTKDLPTSTPYTSLPTYISVTICSYDPFCLGDMYYEAKAKLTTHPEYDYNDGTVHIFLYADGNINLQQEEYGKRLKDLLQFIVSGEKPDAPDADIEKINGIISDIKQRSEVTKEYMRQWERELIMKQEVTEAVTRSTKKDAGLSAVTFNRKHNISDEETADYLKSDLGLDDATISEIFSEANSGPITVK